MWYLQSNTFLAIAAFSLGLALLRHAVPQKPLSYLTPLVTLLILGLISLPLVLFYLVYLALGYLMVRILGAVRWKRFCFVLGCLLALLPFFLSRAEAFSITLPFSLVTIGIAFQMLKLIDVFYYVYYSGEMVEALVFFNYMLFLPVFTAGPIFRYRDFAQSFASPILVDVTILSDCVKRIIRGLFKKVVLAEVCLVAMNHLLTLPNRLPVSIAIVIVSYLLLYLDLSGYSDIAIAFGRLAGLSVPENFKRPLHAPTFTQFWRSWHATLSDWIREHIYVVVAKKRLGKGTSSLIAFFTMVIMSLWHGFNLPYLLAGVYNGLLLMGETLLSLTTVNKRKTKKSIFVLRCGVVNFLFALNTLVFTLTPEQIQSVLSGFVRL